MDFGIVIITSLFFGIAIFFWWKNSALPIYLVVALVGSVLFVLGLIFPSSLSFPNRIWTKFGLLMFVIVNPIIMFAIYIFTIVPIGAIMRVFNKDPLSLRWDPTINSYWIQRESDSPSQQSMRNQF